MGINLMPDSEGMLFTPIMGTIWQDLTGEFTISLGTGPGGSNVFVGPTDGTTITIYSGIRGPTNGAFPVIPGQVWTFAAYFDLTSATAGSVNITCTESPDRIVNGTLHDGNIITFGNAGYSVLTFTVGMKTNWLKIQPATFQSASTICPVASSVKMSQPYASLESSFSGYAPSSGQMPGGWTAASNTAQEIAMGIL